MRKTQTMYARALAMSAVGIVCSTLAFAGQGFSQYRDFELGSSLASVSARAGIPSSEARMLHQRPAVLQELEWRSSRWTPASTTPSADPLEQVLFNFYNDQLFRVVADYRRERTEGLMGADMIEAISAVYGKALPRAARAAGTATSRFESESGVVLARWGDAEHAIVLYQASSGGGFRLVVVDSRLENLARKAEAQSQRLDAQEAPEREVARQQKARDEEKAAAAKARLANKSGFRP